MNLPVNLPISSCVVKVLIVRSQLTRPISKSMTASSPGPRVLARIIGWTIPNSAFMLVYRFISSFYGILKS
jgi:hypothetical protein